MRLLRATLTWGRCPQTPEIYRIARQNGWSFEGTGCARPLAIPAAESALGSHLCVPLSSAQVLPGWTTSTPPCNDFSANGDYPLNFVSHSRGSLQMESPRSTSSVNANVRTVRRRFWTVGSFGAMAPSRLSCRR